MESSIIQEVGYDNGKLSSVRNPDGIWINTELFKEAGNHFMKHKYYCADPWGSSPWYDFWKEERRRCREGYSAGGVKITGDHYHYLNYSPIQKVPDDKGRGRAKKITGMPDFWDGDYNYFWVREIARNGIIDPLIDDEDQREEIYKLESKERAVELKKLFNTLGLEVKIVEDCLLGGWNLIVGKSRRKGYSYKAASIGANNFVSRPRTLSFYGAYDKKFLYPAGIFTMAIDNVNFLNINTAWVSPMDAINKPAQGHIKSSYYQYVNGIQVEKGFLSEILAESFKDNPDSARGKDAYDVFMEESGAFGTPGLLKKSYFATQDVAVAGAIKTGMITVFGCVCKGTKVWNHKGKQINIEDVTKESGIVGYAGIGTTKEPVTWIKPPAKKDCYRITTSKGLSIECSHDHPLLWSKNKLVDNYKSKRKKITFKRAEDIKVGDQLMIVKQVPIFGKKRMSNPRLVGLLIGDGYYGSYYSSPQIAISEPEILNWLKKQGITYSTYKKKSSDKPFFRYITLKNKQPLLRELGVQGQSKFDKRLPEGIEEYDMFSISELLGGYFDADGYIRHDVKKDSYKISLVSSVKELLEQVKELLLKLGITAHIFKRRHKPGKILHSNVNNKDYVINVDTSYSLEIASIHDVIQFKKHIRFTVKHKKEILDSVNENKVGRCIVNNGIFGMSSNGKGKYFEDHNELNGLESVYVKKVEFIGERDVYNLTAGYTHTYITNQFVSANTSGNMDKGTADYADMYFRPEAFGFISMSNIWDKDAEDQSVGFFHPVNWNMEGFYDKNGNSDKEGAKNHELGIREKLIASGATSTEMQKRGQERPLGPLESFSSFSGNVYPVAEIKAQLDKVRIHGWQKTKGTCVTLTRNGRKIIAKPILDGTANPITSYHNVPDDKRGCPIIYEYPIEEPPRGLYKIGYDPIRQDKGTSLAAITVTKGVHIGTSTHDTLVAEYIGRYEDPEEMDRIASMFADLYNCQIMYENEVTGVKTTFRNMKRLDQLALQPDNVISKNVKKSKVARVYGCHMTAQLKDAAERYTKAWLTTVIDFDENGDPVRVLDKIYSIRLLEELSSYYRDGNFDLISSLYMNMFQREEEVIDKIFDDNKQHVAAKQLLEMVKDMYNKN